MDDRLLVGVLNARADRGEQLDSLPHAEAVSIAVVGDGDALHELHHEVGSAAFGGAGIEDLGDGWVVHQGQRLAFGVEAGQHLRGVHAALDQLERDAALNGLCLLGLPDLAHAPFPQLLEKPIVADGARFSTAVWQRGRAIRVAGPGGTLGHGNPLAGQASGILTADQRPSQVTPWTLELHCAGG